MVDKEFLLWVAEHIQKHEDPRYAGQIKENLSTNQPMVERFIAGCLTHWLKQYTEATGNVLVVSKMTSAPHAIAEYLKDTL